MNVHKSLLIRHTLNRMANYGLIGVNNDYALPRLLSSYRRLNFFLICLNLITESDESLLQYHHYHYNRLLVRGLHN